MFPYLSNSNKYKNAYHYYFSYILARCFVRPRRPNHRQTQGMCNTLTRKTPSSPSGTFYKNESAKISNTAVKVYWHVISKDSTLKGGSIPDSQIANQISVLNKDYAGNIA
ncbi:hypothetical protein DFH09DRAFT_1309926 [Mycena vulgaris]|nr:hypothetical protein DFH09DRAFT_1309926 [Mycena vulgaris]